MEFYDEACSTQMPKPIQGDKMRTTEWKVTEGKKSTISDNYTTARAQYLDAVKRNKEYRKSNNIFTKFKAKAVSFSPIN